MRRRVRLQATCRRWIPRCASDPRRCGAALDRTRGQLVAARGCSPPSGRLGIELAPGRAVFRLLVLGTVCLSSSACAALPAQGPPPAAPAPAPVLATSPEPSSPPVECPANTPATWVGSQAIGRGSTLVFTTSEDAGALRERVQNVALPSELERAGPHLDVIPRGVRLVFIASNARHAGELQQAAQEHARAIAQTCGLALRLRGERHAEPASPAVAPAQRGPAVPLPAAAATPKAQKVDAGPGAKPKPNALPSPPATGKGADPVRPPAKPKPPSRFEPKQPRIPLPGLRPEPIHDAGRVSVDCTRLRDSSARLHNSRW